MPPFATIGMRKKTRLTDLAAVFGLALLAVDVSDYVAIVYERRMRTLPASWANTILYLHVVAFYLFLVGFLYSFRATHGAFTLRSATAFCVTFAALVLRVDFEFRFLDLQPAVYK